MFMYLLETANVMFLSFIRLELLSLNTVTPYHSKYEYNSVALLLGYNKIFFLQKVLDFLPICFLHILFVSGKPHSFSWERLDS